MRTEFIIVYTLGIVGLAGGFIGWQEYYRQLGEQIGFWAALYKTLQLFFLNSDFPKHEVPEILNFARFAAPMSLATAIIGKIVQLSSRQTNEIRIKFFKKHCVICGLDFVGYQIAEDCLLKGRRVVVIESNQMNPKVSSLSNSNAVVLFGDAADPKILKLANIEQADVLFAVTGSDAANMNIAYMAKDIVDNGNVALKRHLTCIIHISLASAYHLFFNSKFYQVQGKAFSIKLFNVNQLASDLVLDAYPPERMGSGSAIRKKGDPPVNIMLVGLGNLGEHLLISFARTGHYMCNIPPDSDKVNVSIKNKVVVVDVLADKRLEEIAAQYPKLDQIVECRTLAKSPSTLNKASFAEMVNNEGIQIVFLCVEDDGEHFAILQMLHEYLLRNSIKVIDLMPSMTGSSAATPNMGTLWGSDFISENEYRVFDYHKRICKLEILVNDKLDDLAKTIHSLHGATEWGETSEVFKQSSRYQAEHLKIKLRAMGFEWSETNARDVENYLADNPQIAEDLAQLEHIRYVAERFLDGWELCNDYDKLYLKSERDEEKKKFKAMKLNSTLKAYSEIDETSKAYNRESIKKIPDLLLKMRVN